MTGIHRLARLLVATTIVVLAAAAASVAKSSPYPPPCRAGSLPGVNPPDACVHTSYRSDAYTTPLVRGPLSVTHRLVRRGRYSYVAVSVKVGFSDALPECPEGGVPLQDIPCQQGSASIGFTGRYVRGQRHLNPAEVPFGDPSGCTMQEPHGVCTFDFRLYEDETPGLYVGVMQISVFELTKNPANDGGEAGFQFAVGIDVPKPPKTH